VISPNEPLDRWIAGALDYWVPALQQSSDPFFIAAENIFTEEKL
jgi:hypothetical protein